MGFGSSPFSVLQAVTQSVQPLAHFVVSISMPQRTLGLAPAVGVARLRDLDQPDARREHDAGQAGGGDAEKAAAAHFGAPCATSRARLAGVAPEAVDLHRRVAVAADAEVGLGLGHAAGLLAGVALDAALQAELRAADAAVHGVVALVLEKVHVAAAHDGSGRRDALRAGGRGFDHRPAACGRPARRQASRPRSGPRASRSAPRSQRMAPTPRGPSGCSRWGTRPCRCGSRCTWCSRCRRSGRSSTWTWAP